MFSSTQLFNLKLTIETQPDEQTKQFNVYPVVFKSNSFQKFSFVLNVVEDSWKCLRIIFK